MKLLLKTLSFVVLICSFSSCQKEVSYETPVAGSGGTSGKGSLKMKIDGVQWVADATVGASIMNDVMNVTGLGKDKKTFIITFLSVHSGKFSLNPEKNEAAAVLMDGAETTPIGYASNQGADSTKSGGIVNVTKIDTAKKTMSGTFSGILLRAFDGKSKKITEGIFENISYATTLPASSGTDTFSVKINDTLWQPQSISGLAISFTNQISIVGNNAQANKTVGITVPGNIAPGSFTFGFFEPCAGQYNFDGVYRTADGGTLQILEHNTSTKRIRGKFNFNAISLLPGNAADVKISEGYFSVKYK
jgi:Family of unknown function (DUF6252)